MTNPAYAGLRAYTPKGGERQVTRACWEPIVEETLLRRVEGMLKKNRYRLKTASKSRYPYLLSGLSFCGSCRDTMNGKSAHGNGGKIPYYEHGWATRRQGTLNKSVFACQPHRVQARILEPAVWEEVLKVLSDPEMAASLIGEAQKIHTQQSGVNETDKLRGKLEGVSEQIEALAEHLAQIPRGVSPAPIFAQMQRLEALKQQAQTQMDEAARSGGGAMDLPASLGEYEAYLKLVRVALKEAPELRAKIVQKLVHKVEVLPNGFRVHFYVGKSVVVELDVNQKLEGPELAAPGFSTFSNRGSKRLTYGWLDWD